MRKVLSGIPEPLKKPLRQIYIALGRIVSRLRRLVGLRPWRHVVVCGYPRSGTSLLFNMLSSSLPGFVFHPFEIPARERIERWGDHASKNPLDVVDIPALIENNPLGKEIIVIVPLRDPRDVVTSKHPVLPDRYFIGFDHSWWPQQRDGEWKYDAAGIREVAQAIEELRTLTGAKVVILRYEDLVADPDGIQRMIASETGLRFAQSFSDYHRRPESHAYSYKGRFAPRDPNLVRENAAPDRSRSGKWRAPEHRERLLEQFGRFPELFELVRRYGYEQDDLWYQSLANSGSSSTESASSETGLAS